MFHFNYRKIWRIELVRFLVLLIEIRVEWTSENIVALHKRFGEGCGSDREYERSHAFACWVLHNRIEKERKKIRQTRLFLKYTF